MSEFKIALPGSDIHTSKLKDEVVNSLYPNPKIDATAQPPHAGIIFLNMANTNLIVAYDATYIFYKFPHNYGYVPTCIGNYIFNNGGVDRNGVLPFQYGGLGMVILDADATNINLKFLSFDLGSTPVTPFTMQVRFYVMSEPGYE